MAIDVYKGYSIEVSTVKFEGTRVSSPAIFHIYRKRGEHREKVHSGSVHRLFSNADEAQREAYTAARAWIDEHGE